MKFDDIAQTSLLYDFYGQLLTKRQQEVLELYHGENLSLSEIAEEFSISRQGVHDTLKHGERALQKYEETLGLVEKFTKTRQAMEAVDAAIVRIAAESRDARFIEELEHIRTMIDELDR